ncbi:sialic acid TRAP transporter substrate-binding protein SiaP [Treponema sp.]|jgi:tripartite ATP-independent transporter DctP family solute receptor|uniref:sialic acid TRAP transporter substrate-binding protein SiaP n=1 Tax=Treponema sp. TaxID=166 RepID=UPI0025F69787|nr:sialic acid TRAP transporter substrate-binding protein SiaP [Treponema sp.]MBR4321623.1 sialic acid TRAP transporter substrate-binding protein SiaP [Treponema sp.]
MKKLLAASMCALLSMGLLLSCNEKAEKKVNLIYSVNAVPGDAHYDAMMKFKEVVEAESKGNITVETYHSGSLFKQDQEVAAVKSGKADIVYLSASWLTDGSPWIGMFTAGYVFKSYDDMTKILNGEIGKEVFGRVVKEQGIRPLASYYLGTRQVNLREDKPVRTPADLKGVNLRMPNSEAWVTLGKAMGANPTPLAFSELYMALQTGTVDGQENPLPTDRSAKFYEVTKSISLTNHLVDSVWPCINEAKWQSLSDNQKAIIMKGIEAGRQTCDEKNLKTEAEIIDFFKGQGLKVYEADTKAFAESVLPAYLNNKNITGKWDMDLYNKVQAALK